ncbi:App1 family protein [Kribbella deserti]|uniref:App1 family protein n=1 Tax=Kribbella deserti TaxID=1926257 RepID=A0ABV6QWC0_9ACTN
MARPHYASRLEDWFNLGLQAILRRKGWRERIIPHMGYGNGEFVRVLARVVLSRDPRSQPRYDEDQVVRGWRVFVTAPAVGVPVSIVVGGETYEAVTDRGGFVDLSVPQSLDPGWHEISLGVDGEQRARGKVLVFDPNAEVGLVSDIDDTVMLTMLPRPLIAAWNTFVRDEQARRVVPGMAEMYRDLLAENPGAPIFYLSTGAWNTAPTLTRFLARHGYPAGPMLLTDWGPTNTGWFRSGREHKATALARLARELPNVKWILIGDDGQHDPQLYGDFARTHPEHVRAIGIRQLTPTEQVLSHGLPVPNPDPGAHDPERPIAATVHGPDGVALSGMLRQVLERE